MADSANQQWLTIDDFSAGIYSAPGALRDDIAGFIDSGSYAPLGASRVGTYGCLPGPGGKGLIPGPWSPIFGGDAAYQHRFTEANLNDAKVNPPYQMSGFALQTFADGTKFAMLAVVFADDDGKMTWKLMRDTTNVTSQKATNVLTKYFGTQLAFSRMYTVAPFDFPGTPVCGWGFSVPTLTFTGANGRVGWFPDPTAMGTDASASFGFNGFTLAHQNRFAFIINTSNAYKLGNTSVYFDGEEAIWFSDPPNSNLVPYAFGAVFWPENPSGYAAWGSLSASSLLLVKRVGGAVLLQGDVLRPQVTYLPGVQATGNLMSWPCVSPLGVIYASDGAGVWAWQGGSTSIKISRQLHDAFYRYLQSDVTDIFEGATGVPIHGPSFQAFYHNDYIFVTGGWIYHIPTQGWWRLDDVYDTTAQYMFYGIDPYGVGGHVLWAIHPKAQLVTGTTYRAGYKYLLNRYASKWNWWSQPIRVGTPGHDIEIDEVVLNMTRDGSATGTVFVHVQIRAEGALIASSSGFDTITQTFSPQQIRIPLSAQHDNIEIQITCENDDRDESAAMLHSINIGWREGNLKAAVAT